MLDTQLPDVATMLHTPASGLVDQILRQWACGRTRPRRCRPGRRPRPDRLRSPSFAPLARQSSGWGCGGVSGAGRRRAPFGAGSVSDSATMGRDRAGSRPARRKARTPSRRAAGVWRAQAGVVAAGPLGGSTCFRGKRRARSDLGTPGACAAPASCYSVGNRSESGQFLTGEVHLVVGTPVAVQPCPTPPARREHDDVARLHLLLEEAAAARRSSGDRMSNGELVAKNARAVAATAMVLTHWTDRSLPRIARSR